MVGREGASDTRRDDKEEEEEQEKLLQINIIDGPLLLVMRMYMRITWITNHFSECRSCYFKR